MKATNIQHIDFLKVDTQGSDLSAVKSFGSRLHGIAEIQLECITSIVPLYDDECTKNQILDFFEMNRFVLTKTKVHPNGQFEDLTFRNNQKRKKVPGLR
jgi:hypothetical protein